MDKEKRARLAAQGWRVGSAEEFLGLSPEEAAAALPEREPPKEPKMDVREPLITTSPDRLSGTPVFAGTRIPVQTLFDYLKAGDSLDAFLDDFPGVSREHAIAVLELAKSVLLANAVGAGPRSEGAEFEQPGV